MSSRSMSFKAKISNYAKNNHLPAQVVLQVDGRGREGMPDLYMMEAQMDFAYKDFFEE